MAETERQRGKLLFYALLIALLLLSLVRIITASSAKTFGLELLGLLLLSVLSLLAFVGYSAGWGERVFLAIFSLYLVNLVLLWLFKERLYVVLLIVALIGFFLSFPRAKAAATKPATEPPSVVFYDDKEKKKASAPTVNYFPGKYVASRNSNVYHEPKCEWAKKIEKSRRVWFEDQRAAIEKGYKKHSCVM